jgi:hypothetical protein
LFNILFYDNVNKFCLTRITSPRLSISIPSEKKEEAIMGDKSPKDKEKKKKKKEKKVAV